jgi:hypothetical protein
MHKGELLFAYQLHGMFIGLIEIISVGFATWSDCTP